ncbi:hypothetical protein [Alishewanella phage vB_AspM_Slicko01]|nr:hypothetical protein [Alishewanella phage vB_AspM_Slicko01]
MEESTEKLISQMAKDQVTLATEMSKQIKALEQHNAELKAQVEQFQHRINDLKAANKLSGECLAENQIHARKNGFIAGYFYCRNHGFQFENELEEASCKYANKIT